MRIIYYTGIITICIMQRIDSTPTLHTVLLQPTYPEVTKMYYVLITPESTNDYDNDHSNFIMLLPEIIKIATISRTRRIGQNQYPHVEMFPGVFKTEIVNYQPDTLSKNLQKLYRLKQKYEREHKDLNGNQL